MASIRITKPGARLRRVAASCVLLVLTVVPLPGCGRPKSAEFYSGKIRISKALGLSPDERQTEERFAKYVGQHPEKAIDTYRRQFDKNVNVDNARELSRDYAPHGPDVEDETNREHRTMYSDAVQEPARALAHAVYFEMLTEKPAHDPPLVVFTAGGAGSGKTTSIKSNAALLSVLNSAQIVYDTTLSEAESSTEKIEAALKSGKDVFIIFVYRDPVDAFVNGALPRAMSNGRTLTLDAFADTHEAAPEVLLEIAEHYKGNKKVTIKVIDNTRSEGKAEEADLAFIRGVAGTYKPDALKKVLRRELDDARAKGMISEAVYRAVGRP